MPGIIRTAWSGTSGGPGLTQFAIGGWTSGTTAGAGNQPAVDAVRQFWFALAGILPDELRLTVQPVIDDYDDANGQLIGSYVAANAPASVLGSSATSYAGGAGGKVTWNTGQIAHGRRIKGATFLVPLANGVYSGTGTITPGTITTVNNAANSLMTALSNNGTPLVIWSRPREAKAPSPSYPNGQTARAGFTTPVLNAAMGTKTAILRGRRD